MLTVIKRGLSFGLTSGVITTLGLLIGLAASTNSKAVVLSGIIMIAIADALSDAMGMHVSEEEGTHDAHRQVWLATFSTFTGKFMAALTFALPIILFDTLIAGVICNILWGIFLLTIFSWHLARLHKTNAFKVIGEHLFIATIVIVITYFLGMWLKV